MNLSRWILGPGLLALALASGCSDDATTTDAGATDAGVTDAGSGDGGVASGPVAVAISAAGHDRLYAVTYDSTGRIYAVGQAADSTDATADFRTVVVRFTATGERDATFGEMGVASHNIATGANGENARGLAVQSTGKVVALATVEHPGAADARDRDIALVRFNANGTLDRTFGTMGVVTLDLSDGAVNGTGYLADGAWGLAVYSDDRLLVTGAQVRAGGMDTDFAVVRLNADGSRDTAFGTNGVTTVDINNRSASPRTSTILPDGSSVTAGYMDDGGVVKPVLFKLTPAGQLDTTFAQGGIFAPQVLAAATEAYGAALQGTSFVTAGYGRNAATESLDWLSLRVTAAGVLDTTYGAMGVARIDLANFNDNARAVLVLPGDRVMMVGGGRPTEMNVDGMIAVLTPNGQPDTSFGPQGYRTYDFGGASDFFWGAALSPSRDRVALVGVRGVGSNPGNDDAVIYVMPVP
ncbi:MAG: hypothetical protein R3A52_07285 [Polyangiales bacterium]